MATTTDYKIIVPTVSGDNNAWGTILNNGTQAFENIIKDLSGDGVTTGSANAYAFSPNYTGVTVLFGGLQVRVRASFGNTGASTFNYKALGAVSIRKIIDGIYVELVNDDIALGMILDLVYAADGSVWVLMNPSTLLQTGTAAQFRFGTVTDRFPGVFQYWQAHEEVVLAEAAPIVWDMSTGINFATTIAGNNSRTLSFPTNLTSGKTGTLRVLASGGTRALTLGSSFRGTAYSSPVEASKELTDLTSSRTISIPAGYSVLLSYRCISAVAAPGSVIMTGSMWYIT